MLNDLVENIDILSSFSKIQDIIRALENKQEETKDCATTTDHLVEKLEQLYPEKSVSLRSAQTVDPKTRWEKI